MRTAALFVLGLLLVAPSCTGAVDPDGNNAGDGDGDGDGDIDNSDPCVQREAIESTDSDPADLLLVVDKSGSMADPLDSGERKWPTMRDALKTVVSQYDEGIRFGLQTFPTGNECDTGQVVAGIDIGRAGTIADALDRISPDGGTPTDTTLAGALDYFNSTPVNPAGRYALLATDGEPNCGDPNDNSVPTVMESIAAIERLAAADIPVFVLGFGGDVNNYPDTLQAMAEAGGTGDYFAANNPQQLATALDAIAAELGVVSCTLRLKSDPFDPDLISVSTDGAAVPRDPDNGWTYDEGTNSVSFHGAACDALKDGGVAQVEIGLGCGGPPVD